MTAGAQTSTAGRPAVSISELVERAAHSRPDGLAIVDDNGSLTYRNFFESAMRLAAGLHDAGVTAGSRVGLWLPNTAFWLQAHVALAHLGAVAVGINARYPVQEVARIVRAAGITALVIDPRSGGVADSGALRQLAELPGLTATSVLSASGPVPVPVGWECWDGPALLAHQGSLPAGAPPEAACSVFPSSGSTGAPKLVVHSQQAITAHSIAVADAFAYTQPDSVVLGQLPMCGVWGFNTVYAAIAAMAPVIMMERFEAGRAVELIARHGVTHANGPDLFLRQLFEAAEEDPARVESLRAIGFSTFSNDGEELVDRGSRLGITLFQVYGSSEQQALMVCRPSTSEPSLRADPGGFPSNPATRVRIRDPKTGELAPPGLPGQVESTGPNILLGYLTDEGIDTSALTEDGWVRTGDMGLLDDDGFRFLARDKDFLRLSGFLVDPHEIELRMEEFDDIVDAQVVGVTTDKGPRCVAFVRVASPSSFDEQRVRARCQEELASYKVPVRVFRVDDFPRIDGANGPRIQRLALRKIAEERLSA
ncbi:MAG TPA: AMP-binding protein [Amycolatopsis sp.]|nr:AMP-binding protein [Amycolatopsis sp.]